MSAPPPGFPMPMFTPPLTYTAQQPQQQQKEQTPPVSKATPEPVDDTPKGDGNDDPTNAILITGFNVNRTYQDFNVFFRGVGKLRRCFLKAGIETPWAVMTFENLVDAKKACTSAMNTIFQKRFAETDELTILPLK